MGTILMRLKELKIRLEPEVLEQVEREATKRDQFRTVWIQRAIMDRLNGGQQLKGNYAAAVSAALAASRGKLNRQDAEAVASRVISTFQLTS